MAIVVKKCIKNRWTKKAQCEVYADTKEEVTDDATYEGLPDGYTIAEDSMLKTASLDIAIMQTNGEWKWA